LIGIAELGLIALVLALFVLRAMIPGIARRAQAAGASGRGWSPAQKRLVGISVAVIAAACVARPRLLLPLLIGTGVALVAKAVNARRVE
jgi:hypothetical protein